MWIVFAAGVTRTNLSPLLILMLPVAVFGPIALVWGLYRQACATAEIAHDLADLRREITKLTEAAKTAGQRPAVAQPHAAPTSAPATQSALKLSENPAATAAPLSTTDLILALNFPADAGDAEGFGALKRALADPGLKPIVTAAQDVLTLLSHDGLYMDDLVPERARPDTWRRFARGERGAAVRDIGGIRMPEAVATVSDRLRSDPIFRDTALHFLRIFDKLVTRVEPRMTDTEVSRLADTRSARAFMLVGRAIGTFD